MKLLSLNVWGGLQGQVLLDFIAEQSKDTDIFCFQEVFSTLSGPDNFEGTRINLFQQLSALLPHFQGHFAPFTTGRIWDKTVEFEVNEGLAMFVKNPLQPIRHSSAAMEGEPQYRDTGEHFSLLQGLIQTPVGELSVFNIHGLAFPGTKVDTAKRLEQSRLIIAQAAKAPSRNIICGDFNLMPDTESISMIERELGTRNLIKEFKIQNTRNKLSWDKFPGQEPQHFADFTFVGPEIKVTNFEVPYNEVSDHLPMLLTFDL